MFISLFKVNPVENLIIPFRSKDDLGNLGHMHAIIAAGYNCSYIMTVNKQWSMSEHINIYSKSVIKSKLSINLCLQFNQNNVSVCVVFLNNELARQTLVLAFKKLIRILKEYSYLSKKLIQILKRWRGFENAVVVVF